MIDKYLIPDLQEIIISYVDKDYLRYNLYKNCRNTIRKIEFFDMKSGRCNSCDSFIEFDDMCANCEITTESLIKFEDFSIFPNLVELIINSGNIKSCMLTPTLEKLCLNNDNSLTDSDLSKLPNLRKLIIPNNKEITYKGLKYLDKLEYLTVLRYTSNIEKNRRFIVSREYLENTCCYMVSFTNTIGVPFPLQPCVLCKESFWYVNKLKEVKFKDLDLLKIFAINYNALLLMNGGGILRYSN